MTTADKLVTVADNIEKVYNAGFEKGKAEGGGFPADMEWANHATTAKIACDYIEDETVTFSFPSIVDYNEIFKLNTANYALKHLILNIGGLPTNFNRIFFNFGQISANFGMYALEHITINGDTSQVTSFYYFVRSMNQVLKVIDGTPLDFSSSTSNQMFCNRCYSLFHIRIVPNTIKVSADFSGSYSWDDESLQSIIDGLADLTGNEAQTLTLHTNIKAKLTETQLATITGKNWTLA